MKAVMCLSQSVITIPQQEIILMFQDTTVALSALCLSF